MMSFSRCPLRLPVGILVVMLLLHVPLQPALTARAAPAAGPVLAPGDRLDAGERIATTRTRLEMRPDGNLVLSGKSGEGWRPVWASNTAGQPGAFALMQEDGNFVVYNSLGGALWDAGTYDHPGAYLRLKEPHQAVIYDEDDTVLWVNGSVPWQGDRMLAGDTLQPGQSVVSANGRTALTLAASGEVVLTVKRGRTRRKLWSSRTAGNPGARLVMQQDGNLVLYASGGVALWNARTVGHPGAYLRVQNDRKAVIYSAQGQALWSNGRTLLVSPTAGGRLVSGDSCADSDGTRRGSRTVPCVDHRCLGARCSSDQ